MIHCVEGFGEVQVYRETFFIYIQSRQQLRGKFCDGVYGRPFGSKTILAII